MRTIWGVVGSGAVVWTVCCGSSESAPTIGDAGDEGTASGSAGRMGASSGNADDLGGAGQAGTADAAGPGGQGGEAERPLSPDVVSGSVLDYERKPVSGVALEIGGKITTTNADGEFEVSGVTEKYDAYVIAQVAPGFGTNEVDIYEGLSARKRVFYVDTQGQPRSAKIRGALSGGAGFPLPVGHAAALVLTQFNTRLTLMGASYELADLAWRGSKQRTLTIGALSWTNDASGLPTSYDGYGETQVTVSDGATVGASDGSTPQTNIELTPIEARRVTGSLDLPEGCSPHITVRVDAGQIVNYAVTPKSFSYLTPIVPQHPTTLNVQCNFADSGVSLTGVKLGSKLSATNPLELSIPQPPVASLPVNGASNVRSNTAFAWSGEEERGEVEFTFTAVAAEGSSVVGEGGDWRITRFGAGHATTFPDLSRFGLSFPEAQTVSWQVVTFCASSAIADDADASVDQVSCFASSPKRTFTTPAPPAKP